MPEPMSPTEFRQHLAELLDLRLGEIPDELDGLWGLIKPALAVTRTDRDRWMGVATSEQAAHAATQAALTTTREENQRLRAELAALQARTAKAIAATLPASPDLPPRAEGDVRDGVMSEEDFVWDVLQQVAGMTREDEPRLYIAVRKALTEAHNNTARAAQQVANARRLCKVLVDDIIDGRQRR